MTGETYIWRTVDDGQARPVHAARNGKTFSWAKPPPGGHPGEDFGCRCWAEPVKDAKSLNCAREMEKLSDAQKRVQELSDRFNDLLLQLNELRVESNSLIQNTRNNLGARIVAYILTLPFDRYGVLGELLQRSFENIISNKLIEAAKHFMKQLWAIKNKIRYIEDQGAIVFTQLQRAAEKLEEAREAHDRCERNEK